MKSTSILIGALLGAVVVAFPQAPATPAKPVESACKDDQTRLMAKKSCEEKVLGMSIEEAHKKRPELTEEQAKQMDACESAYVGVDIRKPKSANDAEKIATIYIYDNENVKKQAVDSLKGCMSDKANTSDELIVKCWGEKMETICKK